MVRFLLKLTKRGALCRIMPTSQEATGKTRRKCALLYMAVGHFPEKGGVAYAERSLEAIPSISDMLRLGLTHLDEHIPKCALTARLLPERSTILFSR